MDEYKDWLDVLIAGFTLIGMLYAGARVLRPVFARIGRALDRLELTSDAVLGTATEPGLVAQFDSMRVSFDSMKRVVLPNGGSSMDDRVSMLLSEMRVRLDADATTGHFSMDRDGKVLWANKAFHRWFGTQSEDVLGMRWLGLVHPDDREAVAEDVHMAVKDGRFTRLNCRMQDGSSGWLRVYAEMTPLRGSAGALIGYNGFIRIDSEQTP